MAASAPAREPTRASAGASLQWDRHLPDYPSTEGWEVAYALRGAGSTLEIGPDFVVGVGDTYQVRIPAADMAELAAGAYRLIGWASKGIDRFVVYSAPIIVSPDFTAADAGPALGRDEELLRVLEDAIAGRLGQDVAETYSIDGVAVGRIPVERLYRMLGEVRARVRRQRTGKLTRTVKVRYGR